MEDEVKVVTAKTAKAKTTKVSKPKAAKKAAVAKVAAKPKTDRAPRAKSAVASELDNMRKVIREHTAGRVRAELLAQVTVLSEEIKEARKVIEDGAKRVASSTKVWL